MVACENERITRFKEKRDLCLFRTKKDASRRFYSPQAQVKKYNVVITSQYLQTKNKGNTEKKKRKK